MITHLHMQVIRLTLNNIEVSCTTATESEREPPNERSSLSQGAGMRLLPRCSVCPFRLRRQRKIPTMHGNGVYLCVTMFKTMFPLSNSSVRCPSDVWITSAHDTEMATTDLLVARRRVQSVLGSKQIDSCGRQVPFFRTTLAVPVVH